MKILFASVFNLIFFAAFAQISNDNKIVYDCNTNYSYVFSNPPLPENPGQKPVPYDMSTMVWRNTEDIILGWDWSLPPEVKPVPTSHVYLHNKPEDFRGNVTAQINWSWRQIEPQENIYDFELLRKAITKAGKNGQCVELHIRASVWEILDFPNKAKYPKYWNKFKKNFGTAPRWLAKYNIPLIKERAKTNLSIPFQLVNMDIYHDDYCSRYIKMLKALGNSSIPRMKKLTTVMIHVVSSSLGEEGSFSDSGPNAAKGEQILRAWAEIFKGNEHKLCYVANRGKSLDLAYKLGIGQRNGFVEHYMMHINNPQLGQSLDKDGYLIVDESCSPITNNSAFGDENEEYTPIFLPRFGPMHYWPHRYRESMLRALQMRRNFLWAGSYHLNPPLLSFVGLELGRNIENTPDAWCYLRESYIKCYNPNDKKTFLNPPRAVKNFERWLYQRGKKGYETEPAVRVDLPEQMFMHPPQKRYDYIARKGNKIGFDIDDRFLKVGCEKLAVKITYHDIGNGKLAMLYPSQKGLEKRFIQCRSTEQIRTVTLFLDNADFSVNTMEYDLVIQGNPAVVSFVRIIK
ncbi:MAG: hypothetical protein ACYSSI_02105 [Planctomycetota bacterium]|jgi:hypothetical protein